MSRCYPLALIALGVLLLCQAATARNPIRSTFFSLYPEAEDTQVGTLPSNSTHCGACHFDFDGGGMRNPYGFSVEVGLMRGLTNATAILAVEALDADGDGFSNLMEITDAAGFGNTPTFPGLKLINYGEILHVNPAEVEPHLTPSEPTDTTPPVVAVLAPNGGETLTPNSLMTVTWTAADTGGVAGVDVYLSDDGGATMKQIAKGLLNDGVEDVFLPILPGSTNRIVVVARDPAGNVGSDMSDADVTIAAWGLGSVPTTLRDFELPGTQPFGSGVLDNPDGVCRNCHGDFDAATEPWFSWSGSMMGNAMTDPVFIATMIIAEQDAPASGDICLRCHTPGGWQEGRSLDTTGGMLNTTDMYGVQCDYCHRSIDTVYREGVSPAVDEDILEELDEMPPGYGNGEFVTDPDPIMRGPYVDAEAAHQFYESDFHLRADICGTCHDVSNPVFEYGGAPGLYVAGTLDEAHVDGDTQNMFPVERTFSEWSVSEYALGGVYAPEFAGDRPDGMVGACQDCHMADVTGRGADGGPIRSDLGLHDLTGGNHFVPDILLDFFPGAVDQAALDAAKARVDAMLQKAATLEITEAAQGGFPGIDVRVINETGHKLPSGYPEGRRTWLNVRAFDAGDALIYESGAYDPATGELSHDADAKLYHIVPGTSMRLGALLGLPTGPSFHFVLSDTVFLDNRIPPRGFTNAAFESVQSQPVGHAYADGQYWDDTHYELPVGTVAVEVNLYYQSISKEYVEFLRDENTTDDYGQRLYDAWVAQGMAPPQLMENATFVITATDADDPPALKTGFNGAAPNPFNPSTTLFYTVAADGPVSLKVFDGRGRLVRTLVDAGVRRGAQTATWDGRNGNGRVMGAGVYLAVFEAGGVRESRKLSLIR